MKDGVISPTHIQLFEHMEKTDPIVVGQFSEETQWYVCDWDMKNSE